MTSRGVLRRANVTLIGSGLGGVLAIVNEILCARYLGLDTYGLYALALILARIAETVSVMGLPVATLHYVSIYRNANEPRDVIGAIYASACSPLLIGGLLAGVLWGFAPLIAARAFGNPDAAPFIRAMALAIPFMALSEVLAVVTRGFGYAGYYVFARNVVPPVVFLSLLMVVMNRGLGGVWVATAFAAAYAVAAAVALLAVVKVSGPAILRAAPRLPLRALYTYALPVLLNTLLYLVVACTSILLLGVMRSDREVGLFRACMQLVIPFDMVVIAFNAAVGHLYPVLEQGGRRAELAALVQRITGWMLLLSVAMLLVIAFNRHDLMRLMGDDFVAGADALLVLALGQALLCSIGSAGYLLVMSGRQRHETLNAAAAATTCVVLNWLLIPPYGILGAALATTLACLLVSILRVVQVHRLTGISVLTRSSARLVPVAAITSAAAFLLTLYPPLAQGNGLLALAARIIFAAVGFGVVYWHVGLTAAGREELAASLRALAARASRRA